MKIKKVFILLLVLLLLLKICSAEVPEPPPAPSLPGDDMTDNSDTAQTNEGSNTALYIFIAVGVLIIAFVVLYLLKQKKTAQQIEPSLIQLKNYIQNTLERGYNYNMVRQRLIDSGWEPDMVDKAYNMVIRWQ